ncbi:putative protein kinase [Trypanosoma theileri]|uniref:Protein kinase n=1 Tax=Trypanosoma theileri TaxID=67003 RepID=A0A1X0NJJ7_9TRYP|nr:putative protein kinase [Trypanosoma theileri]ORC84688.1 putative protein kinase [Trypanosoma theileri]
MPSSTIFTGSSLLEDETVVLKDYVAGQRLGEGSYGSVYLVTYVPSGEHFALKVLQNNYLLGHEAKIIQEAIVMQSLEHPHVVKLYKFLQSTTAFYFVLELAEGGELFDLIISQRYFKEDVARLYFQQLISAIDYCHSNGVAHRDLKAENLLLGKKNKLLVCDFGFSSKAQLECVDGGVNDDESQPPHETGTLHYTSPEMAIPNSNPATVNPFQQDLWSAGIILFFMLTGRLPFDGRDDEETMHLIQRGKFEFQEEEVTRISAEARALVKRMLAFEPTERPTVAQIIENKWFAVNLDVTLFPRHGFLKQPMSFLDFSIQHNVTCEEEAVLKAAFHKIDIDEYGEIGRDQIRDMLNTLHGEKVSADDVSELMELFTGDRKSKSITYQQFYDAWVKKDLAHRPFKLQSEFQLPNIIGAQMVETEREVVRQLRAAFDSVDELHTGVINVYQWRKLFKRCNIDVTDEEIKSLMRFFDEREIGSNGEITFDKFLIGVVKRDILVRHPMGKKLAIATNLASLLESRNVSECIMHGFLVFGLPNAVLKRLTSCRERLMLMYNDDMVSTTSNVYSFRYLGSAALQVGTTMETATPMLTSSTSLPGVASSLLNGSSTEFLLCRSSDAPSLSESLKNANSASLQLKGKSANSGNNKSSSNNKNNNNNKSAALQLQNSKNQAASSQTHRVLAFGSTGVVNPVNGVCDIDITLVPASLGYTLVRTTRIYGKTSDYHEAVAFITSLLDLERRQAMQDTLPRGESELM